VGKYHTKVCRILTIPGPHLWLDVQCLANHDGRVWIVLLHGGIGAQKELAVTTVR
jgi:hypothetical protein